MRLVSIETKKEQDMVLRVYNAKPFKRTDKFFLSKECEDPRSIILDLVKGVHVEANPPEPVPA